MSCSFIAGYTGSLNDKIAQNYARQLNARFTGSIGTCSVNNAHFFFGDTFKDINAGEYSGGYAQGDELLCFSANFRESPGNWRQGEQSLAQALLQGLQEQGTDYINRLRGSFVIAWYSAGRLSLIRDRAGQYSLYHCQLGERRCFASEPGALINLDGFERKIEPAAVVRYFTFSFQPGEHTMLQGLHKLPPCTMLSFEGPNTQSTLHYSHSDRADCDWLDDGSKDGWLAEFNQVFSQAVYRGHRDGSEAGAFLSGGLDSSLVAAELQSQTDKKLATYSLHFGRKYDNELSFARQVADYIGSEHHEIELSTRNMLEKLNDLVSLLNDPIGDPVTFGNYELARRLGGKHPVMFNGEGGDPCFGGPKNLPMMLAHAYYLPRRKDNWRAQMYLRSYQRAYQEWPRLLRERYTKQISPERDLEALITPYFNRPHNIMIRQLLELNQCEKGAQLILPKVEKLQGSAGIVAQSPLFDEDIIDLSMRLPTNLILAGGVEKVIMKQAARGRLPETIINRPKSGMRVPVYHWFNGPLKKLARKVLEPNRIHKAGIFDMARVREILHMSTEESQSRYGIWLWMLVTFELWRLKVIEQEDIL